MAFPSRFRPALLAAVLAGVLGGCNQQVVHEGASQNAAYLAFRELKRSGVDANLNTAAGRWTVLVDKSSLARASDVLAAAGLPERSSMSVPELFPSGGLIVTPFEQKARLAYAVNEEIRRQIMSIDGILDAQVRVAVASEDWPGRARQKPSASAVVRTDSGIDPLALTVKLKLLIAGSVEGLDYERVTVVTTTPALRLPPDVREAAADPRIGRPLLVVVAFLLFICAIGLAAFPNLRRLQARWRAS